MFVDPSLTAYEADQKQRLSKDGLVEMPESASQIINMVNTYKDANHQER